MKRRLLKFFLNFTSSRIFPAKLRVKIINFNKNINIKEIRENCYFNNLNLEIGEGTFINRGCEFHSSSAKIKIKNNCYIGMNVSFITISHKIGDENKRAGINIYKDIEVGNGCWIGANVTILPGVTIGDGCVIGAGSVVTKDCKSNTLYAGVPAREIRDLD